MVCYLLIGMGRYGSWLIPVLRLASRRPGERAVEDLGPAQGSEVAVDAEAQGQFEAWGCPGVPRRRRSGSPARPYRRWPRRRPGGWRGNGTRPHDAGRGLVGQGRTRPFLRRNHQPVGVPVPAHGEEPLGVRRGQHPAQAQLEDVGRNGAVGQFQLLGYVGQPPHLGGSDQNPRRQVCALGLDVEAPGPST